MLLLVCSQALQGQTPCGKSNCGDITNSMICVNTGLIEVWAGLTAECSGTGYDGLIGIAD